VNRLRDEILKEPQERERAISAERKARREELRAERERLERLITAVHQEIETLREVTTGDLGLRAESVAWLVGGIVLTTWSEWFADWLPSWPPFRVAVYLVLAVFVARMSWSYCSWLAKSQAGRPARRGRPGAPWHR
jgi:hypothetical protein